MPRMALVMVFVWLTGRRETIIPAASGGPDLPFNSGPAPSLPPSSSHKRIHPLPSRSHSYIYLPYPPHTPSPPIAAFNHRSYRHSLPFPCFLTYTHSHSSILLHILTPIPLFSYIHSLPFLVAISPYSLTHTHTYTDIRYEPP